MAKDQITSNLTPRSVYTWIFTPYQWLVPLLVNIFFGPGLGFDPEYLRTNPWKFQSTVTISQIINDIWTLEPQLLGSYNIKKYQESV